MRSQCACKLLKLLYILCQFTGQLVNLLPLLIELQGHSLRFKSLDLVPPQHRRGLDPFSLVLGICVLALSMVASWDCDESSRRADVGHCNRN